MPKNSTREKSMEVAQPKVDSMPAKTKTLQKICFVIRASPWNFVAKGLLHGGQRTIQIINDVLDILDAHGDTHHAIGNSDGLAPLFAERGMGHGRRMRNQRLDASQRLPERTYAHFPQHFLCVVERSCLEADHRPASSHLL